MKGTGNECAAVIGAGKKLKCCAERLTVERLSYRLNRYILERHVTLWESKPPVLEMRAHCHSADFKNTRKAVLMPLLSVQVSHPRV